MVAQGKNDKEISDLFIRTGRIQYHIMSLILCGFIVFGRPFIQFWAGEEYSDSYYITLLFFVSLFIPLIQNMGITILMARNQMRFRSLLYIIIAVFSLVGQVFFSKMFGAIGCAVAVAAALIIGQGFLMNIYYHKCQRIDVKRFWAQILRMSVAPALLTATSIFILKRIVFSNITVLLAAMLVFSVVYFVTLWLFSMNNSEKSMLILPLKSIWSK